MREITVDAENAERRLDKYLLKYMNKAPKSFIYKMLRKKNIVLNERRAYGNEILRAGDKIRLYLSESALDNFMEEYTVKTARGKIDIIYEDENVIICDKPAGILSHSADVSDNDTMIDRILFYLNDVNELDFSKSSVFLPALCGRLDRNTSGIVICGKNYRAMQSLNKAVADRKIDKYYTALARGRLDTGILTGWLYKNERTNEVVISSTETANSKEIVTEYRAIKAYADYTLIEVKLITGRPHQIRAHLKSIGHPIAGDRKYGEADRALSGQLLHCGKIVFGENIQSLDYLSGKAFVSPLPHKFKNYIETLY